MTMRKISLVVFVLTWQQCLYAQQALPQDTCKTIPKQEQTKPIEPLDSTKLIKCPQCNGLGTIMREIPVGNKMLKRKKKCGCCGVEHWDNIKHFHQECTLCRGKRYLRKDFY